MSHTLILGIGNLLLSDEGVGVHVIRELSEKYEFPPDVMIVDGGTGGLSLLSEFENVDNLYIIDAVLAGEEPGTLVEFTYDTVPQDYVRKDTAHGIDMLDILMAARAAERLPEKVMVLGVEPLDISTPSLDLSEPVSSGVGALIDRLLMHLENSGLRPIPK